MKPLLFDVPPLYGLIFQIAAGVWVVPEIIGTFTQRSASRAARSDRGSYALVVAGLWGGLAGALWSAAWLPQFAITGLRYTVFWLGIGLMLVGVGLRWYAVAVLGRWFSRDVATQSGQPVVQSGPYRLIRHPAYAGALLTATGAGVVLANWASLLIVLAGGLAGILYRIHIEEKVLLAGLGQPYQDYMQRTRRLIPFVW